MKGILRDTIFVHWWKVKGWREEWVNCYSEGVFDHTWNNAFKNRAAELKAWVGIDLNEPRLEGRVNHEIQAKNFKIISLSSRVNEASTRSNGVTCNLPKKRIDVCLEVARSTVSRQGINVSLQFRIIQFVAWLKLAVSRRMLLNGIIGEMYKRIGDTVQAPKRAWGSNVTVLVPIASQLAIVYCEQHINPDIKLTTIVKQRISDVLL